MDRVKRVILLAVLLISSTISLITLNKTMHKRKIDEIEKNKVSHRGNAVDSLLNILTKKHIILS